MENEDDKNENDQEPKDAETFQKTGVDDTPGTSFSSNPNHLIAGHEHITQRKFRQKSLEVLSSPEFFRLLLGFAVRRVSVDIWRFYLTGDLPRVRAVQQHETVSSTELIRELESFVTRWNSRE